MHRVFSNTFYKLVTHTHEKHLQDRQLMSSQSCRDRKSCDRNHFGESRESLTVFPLTKVLSVLPSHFLCWDDRQKCTDTASVHFEMEQNHLCHCSSYQSFRLDSACVLYCPLLLPCSANDLMAVPSWLHCLPCKCHPNGGTVFSLIVTGRTKRPPAHLQQVHTLSACWDRHCETEKRN